jgi:protein-disulfide isomerase
VTGEREHTQASVRAQQRQQARTTRRRRRIVVSAAVLVLLAVVVGIGMSVQLSRSGITRSAVDVPAGTVAAFGIARGQRSAPVTVTVYEDFQCPACRALERYLDPMINSLVERGRLRVIYRPMAFLDDASTTEYSSRALGAAACVLDEAGQGAFLRMHGLLFRNQPAEGTAGLSDGQVADLAVQAGAGRSAVASCVEGDRFDDWVTAATEQASKDGITATPTLLVDGRQLEFSNQEDPRLTLSQAVESAGRP